jgi:four helix bundle protein
MKQSNINPFNDQLRDRTLNMAVEVRNLLSSVKVSAIDRPVLNQLIRSSTSVASNYRAATCSRSDSEYFAKISIVLEESDETKFWLEYLIRIKVVQEQDVTILYHEIDELVRIFSAIRKKMKDKIGRCDR